MARVVIIGGGITGLSAAYFIEKTSDLRVLLLESAESVGGKLRTIKKDGFQMEEGPDCFFSRKAEALDLVLELGLEDRLVEPQQRQFMMLVGGELHSVPSALTSFMYKDSSVIDQADFVSESGRARAKLEKDQPVGTAEDESIASFFRRRFGAEYSQKLAEPLLAGTHSGDANQLSLRALYPSYMDAERRAGSLSAAAGSVPAGGQGDGKAPARAMFLTFKNGIGELIDRLQDSLMRTEIRTSVHSLAIVPNGVETTDGFESADAVLAATTSNVTAKLVAKSNPDLAKALEAIPFSSGRILTVGLKKSQMGAPTESTGFLVPDTEPSHITGCTFASEKWPSRAPDDSILLRIFLRRDSSPEQGLDQVKSLLRITGDPVVSHETSWNHGLPQYEVGHLQRLEEIERCRRSMPSIHLAGTSYRGVGVPDCIRQAKQAAAAIAATFAAVPS